MRDRHVARAVDPISGAASDAAGQSEVAGGDRPAGEPAHRRVRGPAPAWLRAGRPALHELTRNRRHTLMALGAGAVALGALSSTAAITLDGGGGTDPGIGGDGGDGLSPKQAGAFSDRDASYVSNNADLGDLGISGVSATPSQAAAAAIRATPRFTSPLQRDPVVHLLRRTTFGPTFADIAAVKKVGIDAWLDAQLAPETIEDPVLDQVLQGLPTLNMTTAQLRMATRGENNRVNPMAELSQAVIARQIWSTRQLYEVVVDFWNNHINITNPFDGGEDTRSPSDRNVIRKHAFGKFSDMLLASARDPAMMRYLDNASSDRRNVNENYGRELLELHTVGVDGGYTERDVRNSAYLMTGRTVDRDGNFRYEARRHWTGAVKVLGFQHANKSAADGLAVGDAYLRYLATHPSTARYIARKLATRFVSDSPPQSLVDRLALTYAENGTAIVPVLKVLFRSQEFWMATGLKTKRPLENFIATARVLGVTPGGNTRQALDDMYEFTRRLGQPPLGWEPPNGYPDVANAWTSAAGMLETWNSHRFMVQGRWRGLAYQKVDTLLGQHPPTVGGYLDALCNRLVFQPMQPPEREALLKFIGAKETSRVTDPALGGKLVHLAPLILDSVYHALR